MKDDNKDCNFESIIDRIIKCNSEELSNWELGFMESVFEYHILNKNTLSEKQKKKILDINGKVLGRV